MTNIDEAIERAARALIDIDHTMNGYHQSHIDIKTPAARAAISAFLDDAPVTAVVRMAGDEWLNHHADCPDTIFKAMSAALAKDLRDGR